MTTPDEAQSLLPVTPELLPCPVCGEQPRWRGTRSDYARGIYRLQCLGETHLFQAYGPDEKGAITAWNTRISHSLPGDVGTAIEEAQFLCDRLDELDWSMGFDDFGNSYSGHVDPSHSRLKGFLAALTPSPCPGDVGRLEKALRDVNDRVASYGSEALGRTINDIVTAALTPSALSPEPVQKMHELPEGHRWCGHCEQKDPHCSVCEGVGYLPSALSGDAGEGEPFPGCYADLQQRRVTTLAKLGLMLSVMASGEAPEVVGYDAAELYAEVLMALAIEDADDTDIALQEIRDHPDDDCLINAAQHAPGVNCPDCGGRIATACPRCGAQPDLAALPSHQGAGEP